MTTLRVQLLSLGGLLGLAVGTGTGPVWAADPVTPSARKPAATDQDSAANPAGPSPQQAERQRILNSRQWRETRHSFDEWLSAQKIYSPAEAKKIRAEMNAKIARMSPDQLRDFLADTKEKMAILTSPEAEQARLWLAQRMAVEVRATPEQIKELKPDIVRMTAAQLEQSLQQLEAERSQIRQTQKAFVEGRRDQVKNIEQMERTEAKEHDAALRRAYQDLNTPYGNYYRPGSDNNNPGRVPSPYPYSVGTPFDPNYGHF
jgi:hypothetical protein